MNYDENPFIVIWEVTRACELKCLHCRAEAQYRRDPRELTFLEGKRLIDEIYEMNQPMLVFSGGDPLMREDIYELANYAVQKGLRVSMTPSATPNVTKEAIQKQKGLDLHAGPLVSMVLQLRHMIVFAEWRGLFSLRWMRFSI